MGLRVALVGGAGYVGSVLAEMLLNRNCEVTVLDNLMWGNGVAVFGQFGRDGFQFQKFDIREPLSCDFGRFDVVVILAGLVGDPVTRDLPSLAESVNGRGMIDFLEALAEFPQAHKIFISTCSNYGKLPSGTLATEDTELSPLSPYAIQKVQAERYINGVEILRNSTTVLRFSTAYGISPRMRLDLTISEFVRDACETGAIRIYDPDTWRPYAHVIDLSLAVCKVIESRELLNVTGVFNIGFSSQNFTKRMIGELVKKALPSTKIVLEGDSSDARDYRVSFEKFNRAFDFHPTNTLEQHIPQLVHAFQSGLLHHVSRELPTAVRNSGSYMSRSEQP